MDTKLKRGPKDLKQKRDSASRRSLREILQQGAGSSVAPLRGPAATSEPAVKISAKDRDEPVARNLSEVKLETTPLGVSSTDIPLQGTSTSSTPTAGEGLRHVVLGVGNLRLAKKALSDALDGDLKRQKIGQAKQELGAFGNQEMQARPSRENPPPEPIKGQGRRAVPLRKRPEHQKGPGTLRDQGLIRRL
jgi:hypothetical protein